MRVATTEERLADAERLIRIKDERIRFMADASESAHNVHLRNKANIARLEAEVARLRAALQFIMDMYDDSKPTGVVANYAYEMFSEARAALNSNLP